MLFHPAEPPIRRSLPLFLSMWMRDATLMSWSNLHENFFVATYELREYSTAKWRQVMTSPLSKNRLLN